MKELSIIAGALLFASHAIAANETVPVFAGEHGSFSRIAFDNGGKLVKIERDGRIVRLTNLKPDAGFSFAEINVHNKARRIAGAKLTTSGRKKIIEIELGCDCEMRAGLAENGRFMLDVFEGASGAPTVLTETRKDAPKHTKAPRSAQSEQPDRTSVENAHKQMVALLEQAARDGLITIRGDDEDAVQPPASPAKDAAASRKALSPIKVAARREPRASTPAPSTANKKPRAARTEAVEDYKCMADAAFEIDGADFEDEPLVRIADLQTELADAEAADRRKVVRALAEGYLAIGFGEEALALLNDYGQETTLFADLARAVAERPLRSTGALRNAKTCAGAHALWQAFAMEDAPHAALYQRSNGTLKALPSRLRTMVATRLAMRMATAEAWPEAKALVKIAAEMGAASPELDYVKARLEEQEGDANASRDALLEIAAQNSDATDDALLALADSYLKNDADPHAGFTEDIGAVARLHDTPKALLAEAMAWAEVGNVEASLMLLRGLAERAPQDMMLARKAARTVFDAAIASDSEITQLSALNALLANEDWFAFGDDDGERRERTARLALKFGLPNLAVDILGGASASEDEALSQIKAQAALAAGEFDQAIKIAAPYTDDHALRRIIAQANLYSGQYHVALATAATLADKNQRAALSARAAWLGRSWRSAARHFQNLDPNLLTANTALQYALSAYMAQDVIPAAADAVLSRENDAVANGVRSFFSAPSKGSVLERSRRSIERTGDEIKMIEEVLGDG